MKSIKNEVISTIEINKSKFINYLIPVTSLEQVAVAIQTAKKTHHDASHHTYAYIIGLNQENQKFSDDGEPSKTAGYPMLDVLKKNELTNVLNISVRYFGGVKLGASGLVRAYVKSCSNGLESACFTYLNDLIDISIKIPFDNIGNVEKYLRDRFELSDTIYSEFVTYFLTIKQEDFQEIESYINESTKGQAEIITLRSYQTFQ